MPFEVNPLAGTPFVLSRLYETIDLRDCLEMLRAMTVNPGTLEGKLVICDARDGWARLSFEELQSAVSFIRTHEHVFANVRWAMVVSGLLEFGLARSVGLMVGDIPRDYQVFRSIDEACHWAGLPIRDWAEQQRRR